MSVQITSKVVFTIRDSNHAGEFFDVAGVNGLDKHFEECLGGFVEKLYSECWDGNTIKTKQKLYKFLEGSKVQLQTIYELLGLINEIKTSQDEE